MAPDRLVSRHVDETRSERWLAVCALWLEHEAAVEPRPRTATLTGVQHGRAPGGRLPGPAPPGILD
ncbi:MAG TPA: hypothetical protein VK586_27020 [Streptosporangiaceae bacterium]|nr:hypothetical protein [Streptosporangiaceae bacterium]